MIKLIFVSVERAEDEAGRVWVSKAVACSFGVDSFITYPLQISDLEKLYHEAHILAALN